MEHNVKKYMVWLACGFLLIVVIAGAVRFLSHDLDDHVNGVSQVSIMKSIDGSEMIKNISAGYAFNIPTNWWAEATGGNSVAVYPMNNNAPTSSMSSPQCKIEFSVFDNPSGIALGDWMAAHLGSDPTITVRQTSLESVNIAGTQAVRWTGSMDGVTTTLVYASRGTKIYEIVPSSLDENISLDSCSADFEKFLGLIAFVN